MNLENNMTINASLPYHDGQWCFDLTELVDGHKSIRVVTFGDDQERAFAEWRSVCDQVLSPSSPDALAHSTLDHGYATRGTLLSEIDRLNALVKEQMGIIESQAAKIKELRSANRPPMVRERINHNQVME